MTCEDNWPCMNISFHYLLTLFNGVFNINIIYIFIIYNDALQTPDKMLDDTKTWNNNIILLFIILSTFVNQIQYIFISTRISRNFYGINISTQIYSLLYIWLTLLKINNTCEYRQLLNCYGNSSVIITNTSTIFAPDSFSVFSPPPGEGKSASFIALPLRFCKNGCIRS